MKNFMKILICLGIVLTVFALCFSLCGCGSSEDKPETNNSTSSSIQEVSSKEEAEAKFTVKLVDQNGDPIPNVMIQICKDTCVPKATDANGIAKFDFESTDGHKLSLFSCPEGYESEYVGDNYIYLEDGETEYTFEITKK